jgi:hypothetical protein
MGSTNWKSLTLTWLNPNKMKTISKYILKFMYLPISTYLLTSACLSTYLPKHLPILNFLAYPPIFILNKIIKCYHMAQNYLSICMNQRP